MKTTEDRSAEAPYIVGKGEWESRSALPDMWKAVHQCENAGLNIDETETITHWYVFFKQHDVVSLEEFLQKFAEGAQRGDFYDFSKYCLARYRQVHEQQIAGGMHPIEETLIRERMNGAEEMDQLGDEYHEDPKSDFWKTDASIVGPDYRELPRAYVKIREKYASFEDFMADYKRFDEYDESRSIQDQMRRSFVNKHRNDTTQEIQRSMARNGKS